MYRLVFGRFLGFSVFLCLGWSTSAMAAQKSVSQHIDQQNKTMKDIHSTGAPTGRQFWIYGWDSNVWYSTSSPPNTADLKMGKYLMQIYTMYCDLKGKNMCLGQMVLYYSISGKDYKNSQLTVKFFERGQYRTKSTNSFQELRSHVFSEMESLGGKTSISTADRDKIQPSPTPYIQTKFLIHTKSNGSGNDLWKKNNDFRSKMLAEARDNLGKLMKFQQNGSTVVKNDSIYNKNQSQLLSYYSGRRDTNRLTAAISSPNANDSGGRAWINAPGTTFVMKACSDMHKSKTYTFEQNAWCTARGIFLHEIGHVFGLNHCTTTPSKQSSLCTDNFFDRTDGRTWLLDQISKRTNSIVVRYDY